MKYRDFYKNLFENTSEDLVPGGKGDDRPDTDFDPEQLRFGVTVEMEHTNNEKIALEISKDHLTEDPLYYTKLKKAGLADELDDINPGSKLGEKDNVINKPKRHGHDITPTPGNNIVGKIGETPSIDERDGESNLDKIIKSKEKSDMKQKDKNTELELKEDGVKEDATPESTKKNHVTQDLKQRTINIDGTKKGLPTSTPTIGAHGGGKIEGTKKFGDTENRLMKLAGMGGMVTSPCVIGIVSNGPEIEVGSKEDGKKEIEIDLDEKSKITGPGITSDMVSKKPGQEGKKLRWSIPFNK